MEVPRSGPSWLPALFQRGYFEPPGCVEHLQASRSAKKAELKFFCTDCESAPLCELCRDRRQDHGGHCVLQIRRSSLCDGVRVADIVRRLDISGVQPYVINHHKIVFIHSRPQEVETQMQFKCEVCRRQLIERHRFCSLECKHAALPLDPSLSFRPGTQAAERAAAVASQIDPNSGRKRKGGDSGKAKGGVARAAGGKAKSPSSAKKRKVHVDPWSEPSGSDAAPPVLEDIKDLSYDSASDFSSPPAHFDEDDDDDEDEQPASSDDHQVRSAAWVLFAMAFPAGRREALLREGTAPPPPKRRSLAEEGFHLSTFGSAQQHSLPALVR